jgi:hypothetical protein
MLCPGGVVADQAQNTALEAEADPNAAAPQGLLIVGVAMHESVVQLLHTISSELHRLLGVRI